MDKKAKAEAKRERRVKRKQGEDQPQRLSDYSPDSMEVASGVEQEELDTQD